MWPFKSADKLGDSGLLRGFTDWHSHILPGVDDGIRDMEEALGVLADFEAQGVKRVWLTPHIMEDFPNTPEKLQKRFAELKENYKGNIELHLAAEHMLDSLFEERIKTKAVLPIGSKGEHLLVETSYVNPPYGMDEMVEAIFEAGFTPVLAHPERYRYMDEEDYLEWKQRGLLFQSNYMSLLGIYGETARKKLEWMLKEGLVDLTGSDVHRQVVFQNVLQKKPKSADSLSRLVEVAKKPAI